MKYVLLMFTLFPLTGCYSQGGHAVQMADGIGIYSVYENNPEPVGISQGLTHTQVCDAPILPVGVPLVREDLTDCRRPVSYRSSGSGLIESIGGPALAGGAIGAGLAYSGDEIRSSQQSNQGNSNKAVTHSKKRRWGH